MLTRNELRIRQMILAEHRSGSSKKKAFAKITKNFKYDRIPGSTFDRWYNDFLKGDDDSLFEKETEQYEILEAIQTYSDGKTVKKPL